MPDYIDGQDCMGRVSHYLIANLDAFDSVDESSNLTSKQKYPYKKCDKKE